MERQNQQMGTQDHQEKQNEGKEVVQEMLQQVQVNVSPPPSASSSPSHEFSFTISLHPSKIPEKNKSPHPLAIDLSPADEIFFHGHLLPLHLLSHLPVSPRSSTNSLDSFTLPINELSDYNDSINNSISIDSTRSDDQFINGDDQFINADDITMCPETSKGRRKLKTFSLFGLPKWRKGTEAATKRDHHHHHHHHHQQQDAERQKRKLRIDMSHVVKKYMRLVKPFLFLRRRNRQIHRQQPYSFSGNLQVKNNKELRKRRGEYSAPASMRTSPTNSGLLVASGTVTPTKTDSTMEELQAAIQAAIAHCKNSIAASEDKVIN